MSKLLIVIPAYNEEANIVKVVNGIVKNYPQYDYVVVNDGSVIKPRPSAGNMGSA